MLAFPPMLLYFITPCSALGLANSLCQCCGNIMTHHCLQSESLYRFLSSLRCAAFCFRHSVNLKDKWVLHLESFNIVFIILTWLLLVPRYNKSPRFQHQCEGNCIRAKAIRATAGPQAEKCRWFPRHVSSLLPLCYPDTIVKKQDNCPIVLALYSTYYMCYILPHTGLALSVQET